jgi:hypothetical protein
MEEQCMSDFLEAASGFLFNEQKVELTLFGGRRGAVQPQLTA